MATDQPPRFLRLAAHPLRWRLLTELAVSDYRVRDLDAMLAQLRAAGASVEERIEDYDYGRFGWATDPEGNRFELWQPR